MTEQKQFSDARLIRKNVKPLCSSESTTILNSKYWYKSIAVSCTHFLLYENITKDDDISNQISRNVAIVVIDKFWNCWIRGSFTIFKLI